MVRFINICSYYYLFGVYWYLEELYIIIYLLYSSFVFHWTFQMFQSSIFYIMVTNPIFKTIVFNLDVSMSIFQGKNY